MKRDWTDRWHDTVFAVFMGIMGTAMGAYAGILLMKGVDLLLGLIGREVPGPVAVGVACLFAAAGLSLWPVTLVGRRKREAEHQEALRKLERSMSDAMMNAFEAQLASDMGTSVEQLRKDRRQYRC